MGEGGPNKDLAIISGTNIRQPWGLCYSYGGVQPQPANLPCVEGRSGKENVVGRITGGKPQGRKEGISKMQYAPGEVRPNLSNPARPGQWHTKLVSFGGHRESKGKEGSVRMEGPKAEITSGGMTKMKFSRATTT